MAQIGGSSFFVKEKLATILDSQPKPSFLGAIILDSVMNYNSSEGSQVLPNGFEKVKTNWVSYALTVNIFENIPIT